MTIERNLDTLDTLDPRCALWIKLWHDEPVINVSSRVKLTVEDFEIVKDYSK